MDTNLEIGVPPSAPKDPSMDTSSRGNIHLIPQFTYCIQDPLEEPTDCLSWPSKCQVHNPKPLNVTNNMQEHCYLFLNKCMDAVSNQASSSK